jgi:hypothetical protein
MHLLEAGALVGFVFARLSVALSEEAYDESLVGWLAEVLALISCSEGGGLGFLVGAVVGCRVGGTLEAWLFR